MMRHLVAVGSVCSMLFIGPVAGAQPGVRVDDIALGGLRSADRAALPRLLTRLVSAEWRSEEMLGFRWLDKGAAAWTGGEEPQQLGLVAIALQVAACFASQGECTRASVLFCNEVRSTGRLCNVVRQWNGQPSWQPVQMTIEHQNADDDPDLEYEVETKSASKDFREVTKDDSVPQLEADVEDEADRWDAFLRSQGH